MDRQEVIALMQTSRNENEWNINCDTVKKNCGGYPSFWFEALMLSGIARKIQNSWMSTAAKVDLSDVFGVKKNSFELLPPSDQEIAEMLREIEVRKQNNG